MANNQPGAPEQGIQQATLKEIRISGTELAWILGEQRNYLDSAGSLVNSKVIGFGLLVPPPVIDTPNGPQANPEAGFVHVHIVYEDGYKDVFIVADHLVVKNIHILPIAVVQGPRLVVPR